MLPVQYPLSALNLRFVYMPQTGTREKSKAVAKATSEAEIELSVQSPRTHYDETHRIYSHGSRAT
jgi:hypothetical protein